MLPTDSLLSASHSSFQEELPAVELQVPTNAPEKTLSPKLVDFFQGQMSLTEALKLASQAELLQSMSAPLQSSKSAKPPSPKTSNHSEETRTQQLSLFATTDFTASSANPSGSINSSSRVQSSGSSNANKPKLSRAVSSQSNTVQQSLSFEQSLPDIKPPAYYSAQLTNQHQPLLTLSSNVQPEPNKRESLRDRPLLEAINQLSDSEFVRLERSVMEYFSTAPPQPPSPAQQQLVHKEIEQIVTQISSLWIRQAQQVQLVEKLQKNPFSAWNKNYEQAVNKLESTMETISQAITQKEQRENQMQQWHKQAETFSTWKTAPRTVQMQELMEILKLPQMSGRLINIHQTQQHHDQPNQPQRRPLKR